MITLREPGPKPETRWVNGIKRIKPRGFKNRTVKYWTVRSQDLRSRPTQIPHDSLKLFRKGDITGVKGVDVFVTRFSGSKVLFDQKSYSVKSPILVVKEVLKLFRFGKIEKEVH